MRWAETSGAHAGAHLREDLERFYVVALHFEHLCHDVPAFLLNRASLTIWSIRDRIFGFFSEKTNYLSCLISD